MPNQKNIYDVFFDVGFLYMKGGESFVFLNRLAGG
jgi:hypothetical protein